jgi:hypothetical protein
MVDEKSLLARPLGTALELALVAASTKESTEKL